MATQTDVQQLIQGIGPTSVNNGNPNTAWNNPMIPTSDGLGNWNMPVLPNAASVAPLDLASLRVQGDPNDPWNQPAPTGGGSSMLDQLKPVLGKFTVPPPAAKPPASKPVTGGGTGPQGQGQVLGPATPPKTPVGSGVGSSGAGMGGVTPGGGAGVISGPDVHAWANTFGNSMPSTKAPDGSLALDINSMTPKKWDSFFTDTKIGNLIGNVADFFIKGDIFSSDGGFDVSNGVTAFVNGLIPIIGPISSLFGFNAVDALISNMVARMDNKDSWVNKLPNFIKDMMKSHVADQKAQKDAKNAKKNPSAGGGGGDPFGFPGGAPVGNNSLGMGWGTGWGNGSPAYNTNVTVQPELMGPGTGPLSQAQLEAIYAAEDARLGSSGGGGGSGGMGDGGGGGGSVGGGSGGGRGDPRSNFLKGLYNSRQS